MTQMSYFWTTTSSGAAGDQVASYTQAQLAKAFAIIAACCGFEGVAPGYLNELACAVAGANTVAVNTGGAMVDGKPYLNDASVNVTIPSAVGGGNTRIDRIVLRASWAGYDVSITRIAGTDAASPTAPAITQTSGTTYDIQLCQVLVNTSGTCTVTDERVWAIVDTDGTTMEDSAGALRIKAGGVATAHLANDAVGDTKLRNSAALSVIGRAANSTGDPADIAAASDGQVLRRSGTTLAFGTVATAGLAADSVDDTIAGNRVPQVYRRQGGNATNWGTGGTTTYTPGAVRIQVGSVTVAASGTTTVTFPTAFSATPIILISGGDATFTFKRVVYANVTTTGFDMQAFDISGSQAIAYVTWMAIGPE